MGPQPHHILDRVVGRVPVVWSSLSFVDSLCSRRTCVQEEGRRHVSLHFVPSPVEFLRRAYTGLYVDHGLYKVVDVNLHSVLYMSKAALPYIRKRQDGAVVNIASNVVNTLPGGAAAYATTKAGVVALTKVLSKEEAQHGIRVNAISPGIIHAGMGVGALKRRTPEIREQFLNTIPMRRSGGAEEVAAAVVFLVSSSASYVTGQHMSVNGGDRTESYQ